MGDIRKIRTFLNGFPSTIDVGASAVNFQVWGIQLMDTGITASKPLKIDANKKMTSGSIDLASEVTGTLPIGNGGTGSATRNFVDLSSAETVAGIKTFSSAPVGPSSAPTTDYQLSNKKYVDDQIDAHIVGALIYQGTFNASAGNYSAIVNPAAGWFYKISVAGIIGSYSFQVGDNLYINKAVVGSPVEADVDHIDNVDLVSSVNGKVGAVVLVTDDVAESGTPTNKYFTDARAQAAVVTQAITDGVTITSPSENAVFDALAGKEPANANIQSHISSTSNPHSVTKSQVGLTNVDDLQQLPKSYLSTEVDLDDGSGASDTKVPSQLAVKTYVDTAVTAATPNNITFAGVAGEAFAANSTFVVRYAIGASETIKRIYKATSDEQNAPGKGFAIGMIQTTASVSAGGDVSVMKFKPSVTLKSGDSVLGASTADQGKAIWMNKDGSFSLVAKTGITAEETYIPRIVGQLLKYSATVTEEEICIDVAIPASFGFDLG